MGQVNYAHLKKIVESKVSRGITPRENMQGFFKGTDTMNTTMLANYVRERTGKTMPITTLPSTLFYRVGDILKKDEDDLKEENRVASRVKETPNTDNTSLEENIISLKNEDQDGYETETETETEAEAEDEAEEYDEADAELTDDEKLKKKPQKLKKLKKRKKKK